METARPLAETGDAQAQFFLGRLYENGDGVPQDYSKAAEYYRLAAEHGHVKAQNNLAALYFQGTGVSKDYSEAVKWFHKAADQGDPLAQYSLGLSYELGLGIATNVPEAMKWYQLAAEHNLLNAQFALGNLYVLGDRDHGIPVDIQKARPWLEKAAAQGSDAACNSLGFICEGSDDNQAAKWYRQSAESGNPKGQMNLGRFYLTGLGVKKDLTEAYKWFYLASRSGDGIARHYMLELEGNLPAGDYGGMPLTSEQISEAIRQARELQKLIRRKAPK